MTEPKFVRCHICGRPIGFVTVLANGLTGLQQSLPKVKIVAICMECYKKNNET